MEISVFQKLINKFIPRLLSQLDRDKNSLTFGSFDRSYWHFKIRDFSSALLQQSVLSLAYLYKMNNNNLFNNSNVYEWIIGGLDCIAEIQLKDGGFNEYYPNESGYPPTSFTIFALAETLELLEITDLKYHKVLEKGALYLSKNDETKALNQETAGIAALYKTYTILKKEYIKKEADRKLKQLISQQTEDGWFSEYGGADIGYLSVTLAYLTEIYKTNETEELLNSINKLIKFLSYFIQPDGSIGGVYSSRNTEYFLPYGLVYFAEKGNELAESMLYEINKDIFNDDYFMWSLDDRYVAHYVLLSFIKSVHDFPDLKINKICDLPIDKSSFNKYFENAQLYIKKTEDCYIIISLAKNGLIVAYSKGKQCVDYGYRAKINDKEYITSAWYNFENKINIEKDIITVKGDFYKIKLQKSTPLKHFILRVISLFLGKKIIPLLKNKLIFINNIFPVVLERTINLSNGKISVKDKITNNSDIDLNLYSEPKYSLRHVASSKYFRKDELIPNENKNLFLKSKQSINMELDK